jgi:uncharacterized membrane protein YhaH (DUF805 family)
MSLVHYLFGWSGRANRARMWLFLLLATIAYGVVIATGIYLIGPDKLAAAGARPDEQAMRAIAASIMGAGLLFVLMLLFLFYCTLAVIAKRLHDRGKSAWWLIVFVFVPPFVSEISSSMTEGHGSTAGTINGVITLIAMGLYVWAFVELYCLRGTIGDNRYGPDPLAGKA